MSLRLQFLAKGHFRKLESMLFAENVFSFRKKYDICEKNFGIYLGKNVIYPENFFGMSGKFV
jgi:hypothetical protein